MTEQETLRRRIYAADFAVWELHLFLDTHPGDREAAEMQEEYEKKAAALRGQYEEKFGPIGETMMDTSRWAWITEPWPWEQEGN